MKKEIILPPPKMQIDFALKLSQIRQEMLQEALGNCVKKIQLGQLDQELSIFASNNHLKLLASQGLRGELLFAVPCILSKCPKLLGYYRLLLGFSQKAFYTSKTGMSSFKNMEDMGKLSTKAQEALPNICKALNSSVSDLIDGISIETITRSILDDLTLLTLGPQLRGGANNRLGDAAILKVFDIIKTIVFKDAKIVKSNEIILENAAGREVVISFAPDPDIVIKESIASGFRNIVAIEVKGGKDFSNIHNRIGEAEKSHQKAKSAGYTQCWTIVNVDNIDIAMAKQESPTTNQFFRISQITSPTGQEYHAFRDLLISITGIKG